MRIIEVEQITLAIAKICIEACCFLPEDAYNGLEEGEKTKELVG
ncbi:MAG: hypothetical protein ACRDBM_08960 [Sporomusa sp.]